MVAAAPDRTDTCGDRPIAGAAHAAAMNPQPQAPQAPSSPASWPRVATPAASLVELVDNEAGAAALARRWQAAAGGGGSLLLIDPAGRWAGPILGALADATGREIRRLRLLSPAGLREQACIDELDLPPVPGRPTQVRHLHLRRFETLAPSPGIAQLWQHSAMVVVLAGALEAEAASRWLLSACVQASRLGAAGPRWVVFTPAGGQGHATAQGALPGWLQRMRFLPQPQATPGGSSTSAVWNAVFRAWVEAEGG